MKCVGVDGCKAGWFAVWVENDSWGFAVFEDFQSLWSVHSDAGLILIDMPIGLAESGSRSVDAEVRKLLPGRASSVFNAPVRKAVYAESKEQAKSINHKLTGKSLSEQSLGIVPKIADVDSVMLSDPLTRSVVREAHPEVCFLKAGGGVPLHAKRDVLGVVERVAILERFMPDARDFLAAVRKVYPMSRVAGDDIVDAMILAITARVGRGRLSSVPAEPDYDDKGLPMAVWFYEFESEQ